MASGNTQPDNNTGAISNTEKYQVLIDRITASGVILGGLAIMTFSPPEGQVLTFITSLISAAAAFIFTAEVYNKRTK